MAASVQAGFPVEQLNEVDAIVSVETRLIDDGERLREIDQVWALALGELMLRDGQRTPIDICFSADGQRFELAGGGGHRLAAARAAGIEHMKAVVHSPDQLERRKREIAENLHRRDLDPIERAAFVAEAVAIQKRKAGIDPARAGRSVAAQARWQKDLKDEAADATVTMTVAFGWTQEVADALGLSLSTVERDLLLHRRLPPSLVKQLRDARHPILSNAGQLRALAKLEPKQQEDVTTLLCRPDDPKALATRPKSVADALARLQPKTGAAKTRADKHNSAFIGAFNRLGLSEKKGALHELAPHLPAGFQLLDPDRSRSLVDALDHAFKILVALCDGEGVEDEDIHEATGLVQQALLDVNPGAGPRESDTSASVAVVSSDEGPVLIPAAPISAEAASFDPAAAIAGSLPDCLAWVEEAVASGAEPEKILVLVQNFGGRSRFANGTYELKIAKVTATCTAGGAGLVRAWIGAAKRKIEKTKGGEA